MKKEKRKGEKQKKGKKKWIVIGVVAFLVVAAAVGGGKEQKDEKPGSTPSTNQTEVPASDPVDQADEREYTLEHGELVSAVENEIDGRNVLVIKAKISSSYSNKATVDQNYYNVEDLVKNQGGADFDEIQYWAVADMSNGKEEKVVSFTVDAALIQKIAEGSVVANKLGDQVADLFIHSSLAE